MFSRFERFLKPTATPEHPEPPAGLLGFLWHFARQAKPLFIALFVIEFFVALTDAAVPWFMGRIVTFVSAIPPDRFLAETLELESGRSATLAPERLRSMIDAYYAGRGLDRDGLPDAEQLVALGLHALAA